MTYYKHGETKCCDVDFSNDEAVPSCSCYDRKMPVYPCKDMFYHVKEISAIILWFAFGVA